MCGMVFAACLSVSDRYWNVLIMAERLVKLKVPLILYNEGGLWTVRVCLRSPHLRQKHCLSRDNYSVCLAHSSHQNAMASNTGTYNLLGTLQLHTSSAAWLFLATLLNEGDAAAEPSCGQSCRTAPSDYHGQPRRMIHRQDITWIPEF